MLPAGDPLPPLANAGTAYELVPMRRQRDIGEDGGEIEVGGADLLARQIRRGGPDPHEFRHGRRQFAIRPSIGRRTRPSEVSSPSGHAPLHHARQPLRERLHVGREFAIKNSRFIEQELRRFLSEDLLVITKAS